MPIFGAVQIALQEIFGKKNWKQSRTPRKEMKLRKLAMKKITYCDGTSGV